MAKIATIIILFIVLACYFVSSISIWPLSSFNTKMESSMISYDLILGRINTMLRSIIMLSQASSVKDILKNFKAFLLFSKLPVMVLQSVVQENTPVLSSCNIYSDSLFTYVSPYDDVAIQLYFWSRHSLYRALSDGALHEPTNMANASIIAVRMFIFISFAFYGLTFSLAHFFCILYLSMLPYIADTSRTVRVEEQSEHFAYKVRIDFTLPYVTLALSTGMIAFAYAALADFTPRCFLVILTSGAFAGQEFAARSTIQPTGGYIVFTCCYTFHIQCFLSV